MSPTLPLAGVRIIALEQAVAAPLCSRHLADLGAEVIKVERVGGGDFARHYDSFVDGESSHFVWLNRGKRSIALDVKTPEGRQVLMKLLEDADVLLSNLGPGAIERIVADDELVALNPGLIRCVISGYGPDGPYEHRKAFDLLVQGEAGVTASTGEAGRPAKSGVSLADLGAGIYSVAAILAALRGRDASGRGERVEISMFDVMVEWMSPLLLAYREAGVQIAPAGTRHATITPYGPFVTRDGKTLNIAVQNDRQWVALCTLLELTELAARPELSANSGRLLRRELVERGVQDAVSQREHLRLAQQLEEAGIPWGALNSIADVAHHPQLDGAHRWEPVALPSGKTVPVVGSPFRTDGVADAAIKNVPGLGENTLEILSSLGYTVAQTSQLLREGIAEEAHAFAGGGLR